MITAINLGLSSKVYRASIDSIKAIGIESLKLEGSYVRMKVMRYYHTIEILEGGSQFEIGSTKFYLNFEDAQEN